MNIRFSILVCIVFCSTLFAQKQELGKVTIDELKEKVCPKDTSAVAAILFEKGVASIEYSQERGFFLTTEVAVKIKIYKKEGYSWANKSVRYYVGGDEKEGVMFSKAVTYNLVNGAIEKTKLKSEGEFTENVNKLWSVKKITLPNVKEGSIIEYSYTLKSPYISNLEPWNFQYTIPVKYSQYETLIPEYYTYNSHLKGNFNPIIEKNGSSKTISIITKELPKTIYSGGMKTYTDNIQYMESQTKYTLEDIPAIKDEKFVNNLNNYKATITNELVSSQFPNSAIKYYATSWEDIAQKIYEDDDFGAQLEKNNYYEDEITALTKDMTSIEDRVNAIFSFVQNRMNWDKFYGIYCREGVRKAYQTKTGNSAEINLMLVSMLRFVGLDANPVLVSTRSNGVAIFPSRSAFNTVIAAVQSGEKRILLDATSKFAQPNILPIEDLNWFGRLIKKDKTSEMIDLMPTEKSMEGINLIATIDSSGKVTGQMRDQYFNYQALKFRQNNEALSNEVLIKKIEEANKGLEIENYEVSNFNKNGLVSEKYAFTQDNVIDIIGNKMYVSPLFFLAIKNNPFKQETRDYPIDFSFPTTDKNIITITIPEGYVVETLPANLSIGLIDGYANFKYVVVEDAGKIQLISALDINDSIISSNYYDALKDFFKKVIEKENEKVVLKKI